MVTINNPYLLSVQLSGWDTGMYPRANIYWTGSREIDQSPVNLIDEGGGLYASMDFIPSTNGYYSVAYTIYTENTYTISSNNYGRAMDIILVEDESTTSESYISSQIGWISGALEAYGGGGGKSYNVYTRGKSPWTHSQRDAVISGMKSAITKVDSLTRDTGKYHRDEVQKIESSKDTLLVRIDSLMESLSTMRNDIIKTDNTEDVGMLLGIMAQFMSDEELEELYEGRITKRVQKKNRKN